MALFEIAWIALDSRPSCTGATVVPFLKGIYFSGKRILEMTIAQGTAIMRQVNNAVTSAPKANNPKGPDPEIVAKPEVKT
ncbi:hypothetical protein BX616_005829 [Lobosporangium transversale]|nr:hypothetical protein BX616_005829 [Lobosporangium transversale]